jgi:HEAT repeat protein
MEQRDEPAGPGTPAPVTSRAVALAGHTGDEALARRALGDPEGSVRVHALGALARMGRLAPGDLEAALADGDPRVRRRACELGAVVAIEVAAALSDSDPLVVEAAAWALGERGDPAATAALAEVAAGHPDPLCREAAVAALGAIGDRAGLAAIIAALDDRPAVRRRAVLALAPFEGEEVDQALRKAARDRDWQVRQGATDLLGDSGDLSG